MRTGASTTSTSRVVPASGRRARTCHPEREPAGRTRPRTGRRAARHEPGADGVLEAEADQPAETAAGREAAELAPAAAVATARALLAERASARLDCVWVAMPPAYPRRRSGPKQPVRCACTASTARSRARVARPAPAAGARGARRPTAWRESMLTFSWASVAAERAAASARSAPVSASPSRLRLPALGHVGRQGRHLGRDLEHQHRALDRPGHRRIQPQRPVRPRRHPQRLEHEGVGAPVGRGQGGHPSAQLVGAGADARRARPPWSKAAAISTRPAAMAHVDGRRRSAARRRRARRQLVEELGEARRQIRVRIGAVGVR